VTELYLGAALLLVLAAVFFLFPGWFMRRSHRQNLRESNLDWYHLREDELASTGGDPDLLEETRLRLLEDGVDQITETADVRDSGRYWLWFLPVILVSVLMYQQLGGARDVDLTKDLDHLARAGTDADYEALMQKVERRAAQRPDNMHYQAMLGRYYMNKADYARASQLYQGLVDRAPGDATALAMAAQASYLAGGRKLEPETQVLAEKALAVDPHQPTALGLLGMASYERGQYRAAIGYWRRLIAMQDPNSENTRMIEGVIARAQAALGEAPEGSEPAMQGSDPHGAGAAVARQGSAAMPSGSTDSTAATGLGVTVTLQLTGDATYAPTDSVFVFARNPESQSRMPVAVQRLKVADLPVTLRLDDAASMAGQKISALSQVLVVARVSPSGQPGEQYATWQGSLGPLPPEASNEPRLIELRPKKI
jgi:cytochrome c-type biogenesis protein CcmH